MYFVFHVVIRRIETENIVLFQRRRAVASTLISIVLLFVPVLLLLRFAVVSATD
jgi:hypothetical protein